MARGHLLQEPSLRNKGVAGEREGRKVSGGAANWAWAQQALRGSGRGDMVPFVPHGELLTEEWETGISGRTGPLDLGEETPDPLHLFLAIRAGKGSAGEVGLQGELREDP